MNDPDASPTAATSPEPTGDARQRRWGRGSGEIDWRRNLYAVWLAELLVIVGFSMRAPFLPFFLRDLGAGGEDQVALWSGIVNAGGAGVMAISAPIWGIVSDRYGRKPMLLRAMYSGVITVGLMVVVMSPWQLMGLRLVEGALAGTVTAATALVAVSCPRDRLGYALGMVQMAVFSGSSLGPLLGGVLADQIGHRATFGVAAGMLLVGALIVTFLVQERFTPPPPRDPAAERGMKAWRASSAWIFSGLLLTMIGVMFAIRFASSAVQPIMPLYIERLPGGDHLFGLSTATIAGVALGILGLTSALSSVFLGRMGDRRGHERILLVCMFASGALYLPMAIANAAWQIIVLQAIFGIAAGGLSPSANAIIAQHTPAEKRGVIYGVTAGSASLGAFFGPLLGAGLAAAFGFPAALGATAVMLLIFSVVATRVFARHRAAGATDSLA